MIDDCKDIANTLSLVFPEFTFYSATTIAGGIDHLNAGKDIQVLILDHQLPGRLGLDALPDIKNRYPNIKTIMISGYNNIQTAAMKNGADAFVYKPLNYDDLQDILWWFMDH